MEMIESRSTRLRKSHKAQSVLRTLSAIAIGLALVFGLLLGWFSPVYIADPSMAPTLKKDETVLYDRLYKHFFTLRRSDMVVFRDPQTGALLIKRIVGLAGETVSAEDGMLLINEQYMLSEYDYLSPARFSIKPTKVPDGCVYVLSDDRNYGEDSRNPAIGCVPLADILGVVRVRLDRFTLFSSGS